MYSTSLRDVILASCSWTSIDTAPAVVAASVWPGCFPSAGCGKRFKSFSMMTNDARSTTSSHSLSMILASVVKPRFRLALSLRYFRYNSAFLVSLASSSITIAVNGSIIAAPPPVLAAAEVSLVLLLSPPFSSSSSSFSSSTSTWLVTSSLNLSLISFTVGWLCFNTLSRSNCCGVTAGGGSDKIPSCNLHRIDRGNADQSYI
mmetsp:Transcript_8931/g.22541  ORF Transcript_8931/g.22541 Transcript_8931/m.22541 type:complete len:203 (-) Transcript_8931:168-776(-)